MQAVAPKNIQAWIGLSAIEGPGPCENAPRYNRKPITMSTIAAMSTEAGYHLDARCWKLEAEAGENLVRSC